MREVVIDTETTGLNPIAVDNPFGDRIVEIAAVELINHIPTGENFHTYINPERDVPEESKKIHGLSTEFLQDKPKFIDIEEQLFGFITDSVLVIHNADFDLKFLEAEIRRTSKESFLTLKSNTIDTLKLARQKRPDLRSHSLDNLGSKLEIDMSARKDYHGALIDCLILSKVYFELISGQKQKVMFDQKPNVVLSEPNRRKAKTRSKVIEDRLTDVEIKEHQRFMESIKGQKKWYY